MKKQYASCGILVAVCLLFSISCDGPDYGPLYVRVKSFTWDGTLYKAQYDGHGTLTKLSAASSDITFSYDENGRLYRSAIRNAGESVPRYLFTFKNGVWGITESRRYACGTDNNLRLEYIQMMNYASATKLSSLVQQEVTEQGDSIVVGFQQDRKFEYTGNNVSRIYTIPAFNEYSASVYDDKVNPFTMLAYAVGNRAFFPVGRYVNYAVVDFNIPLVTVFSCNNPLKARYGFPPVNTFSDQTFVYTYNAQGLVTKIVWNPDGGPDISRIFMFDYETARRR